MEHEIFISLQIKRGGKTFTLCGLHAFSWHYS